MSSDGVVEDEDSRSCARRSAGWMRFLARGTIQTIVTLAVTALVAGAVWPSVSPAAAQGGGEDDRPFSLPFADPAGPGTWLLAQPYGNTVGAFRQRNTTYAASGGIHFGVDFSAPCGTPIVAIADGVVFAVDNLRFGSAPHNLMLDHPELGYASFYGHLLDTPTLTVGQIVRAGDVIGRSGDPAETCYGRPHLHLEIRDLAHRRKYNPVLLMRADWDNLALIGPFGQAFQYDLDQPRKWQHLDDQPEATAGGPLLNDFANPWPPDFPVRARATPTVDRAAASYDNPKPTAAPSGGRLAAPATAPLRQLTTGGCCTQPFWSPDSRSVLFIDRPAPTRPAGIWAVEADQPGPPWLFSNQIAFYTPDLAYRLFLQGDVTIVELLSRPAGPAEQRWEVPAGGRTVVLSPARTRIAWLVSDETVPIERRNAEVWIANLDGSQARAVATLPRGSILGWASEEVLLITGRDSRQAREQVFWSLSMPDGKRIELARSDRLRGGAVSPGGAWLAYFIALSENAAQNGVWLVRTDGSQRIQLGQDLFGAYDWRDANRLLIIPFEPQASTHVFWEYDVRTHTARQLTDPTLVSFKVANNDWAVSPDGRQVVFVASRDHNLYRLLLPD
jgi:murein DD-endopeptidase MepM/ murein hydrolase activator NlpD